MKFIIVIILLSFIGCTIQFDTPNTKTIKNTNERIESISFNKRCLEGHVVYHKSFYYGIELIEHKLDNTGMPIRCD